MNRVVPTVLVVALAIILFVVSRIGRTGGDPGSAEVSAADSGAARSQKLEGVGRVPETGTLADPGSRREPASSSGSASGEPPVAASTAKQAPEEEWRHKYANASVAELLEQKAVIDKTIRESSLPELERMLAAGEYDVVGKGKTWRGEGWDPNGIQCVSVSGGVDGAEGEMRRATLPRERFADLYNLKAESVWLGKTASRRQAEIAMNQSPPPR